MKEESDRKARDAALWARARDAWRDGAGADRALDPTDLAAYLDGTLEPGAAAALEAALVADPDALACLATARAALAEPDTAAPERVVRRAQALRRPGPTAAVESRGGWWPALAGGFAALGRTGAWAGLAAAVLLLASVSGFEAGRSGGWHMAALDAAVADDVRLVLGDATQDLL